MNLYDASKTTELFVQFYVAIHEDRTDMATMLRLLKDGGTDIEALVAEGQKLFADFKKHRIRTREE